MDIGLQPLEVCFRERLYQAQFPQISDLSLSPSVLIDITCLLETHIGMARQCSYPECIDSQGTYDARFYLEPLLNTFWQALYFR